MTEKTTLEVTKNERSYKLECSVDSPLGEVYDVLNYMRTFIINKIVESNKSDEQDVQKE